MDGITLVRKVKAVVPVSPEMTEDSFGMLGWLNASPEEREQAAREADRQRAEERARSERGALDGLDDLLDRLGWSREYAEHLMQPYCYCGDGMDGWDYCMHAHDEGLVP